MKVFRNTIEVRTEENQQFLDITKQVRDYASRLNEEQVDALAGMEAKSKEFLEKGAAEKSRTRG